MKKRNLKKVNVAPTKKQIEETLKFPENRALIAALKKLRSPWRDVTLKLPILSLHEAKKQAILAALDRSEGRNADRAAEILGVSRSTMYRLMKQFNVE